MKLHRLSLLNLLALLALPMSVPAQTMVEGKIFTSPEQRQYLDYLRKDYLAKNKQAGFDIDDSKIPEIPANAPNAPAGPVEYSLDAIMTRANGRVTIWLNHQSMTEQQLPANFHLVREGNTLALKVVTADGRTVLLRPGQTLDITTGVMQERLHKPAPASEPKAPPATTTEPALDNKTTEPAAKAADKTVAGTVAGKSAGVAAPVKGEPLADEAVPAEANKDASTLDTMIQTLKFVRDGLDASKNK